MSDDSSTEMLETFTNEMLEVLNASFDLISNNAESIKQPILKTKKVILPESSSIPTIHTVITIPKLDNKKIHDFLLTLRDLYLIEARQNGYNSEYSNYCIRRSICMQTVMQANNILRNESFNDYNSWYNMLEKTIKEYFPSYVVKHKNIKIKSLIKNPESQKQELAI